jgi:hypothetical protein
MAKNVTKLPDRSPRVTSKTYTTKQGVRSYPSPKGGNFETFRLTPDKPANTNVSRANREAAIRSKYRGTPKGTVITSGKYAYGPKPAPGPSAVSRVAGSLARGALRAAGPIGALFSMTSEAGRGSDKPSGPLSKSKTATKSPGGGSLSAPSRTTPSKSTSSGGKMGSKSSQSGGAKRSTPTGSKTFGGAR